MTTFLTILLVLAMGATLVTLFMGMVGMVGGGDSGGQRSNTLMRYRVLFQGAALVIFALLLLALRR
ncbi:twin transmembrane helix small protein [Roseomonas sp. CCTCC AB2023176]|uniref:twin transmembrane helix small protein n=1 Tax=Roseomonas sp. CCTCC AB2023176 TaxID=3342640 RepID=UPI0035E1AAA2